MKIGYLYKITISRLLKNEIIKNNGKLHFIFTPIFTYKKHLHIKKSFFLYQILLNTFKKPFFLLKLDIFPIKKINLKRPWGQNGIKSPSCFFAKIKALYYFLLKHILLNAFKKPFFLLKIWYFSNKEAKFEKAMEEKFEKRLLCFLRKIKTLSCFLILVSENVFAS